LALDDASSPATLVIAYKSSPAQRVAFRSWWKTAGQARFKRWQHDGVFADSHILFSNWAGAPYDALAILDFKHVTDIKAWQAIETSSPGGLTPDAMKFGAPAYTAISDAVAHGAMTQTGSPTYLVTFYDVSADPATYRSYIKGYVEPQMVGWMKDGAMARYDLYVNAEPAGAQWQSMLVLDYNGLEGLARRETVKVNVRHSLAANPDWKKLSENKSEVRKEKAAAEYELISN
ncbi:MAG: hypothetical protein KGJ05_10085, partial [Alphaproteobacteria bacterium]|nr:hypothetical protein [Alphaproteobacteria bacterium]